MKFLKYLPVLLFIFVYSCSNSDDSEEKQKQPQNGSISIEFSDGRNYNFDQINATFDTNGVTTEPKTLKITATSSNNAVSGTLTIELYDLTNEQSFINGASVPFQITPANTFGRINYIDNGSTFIGSSGALTITTINHNADNSPETVDFSATLVTSNGNGLNLIGNIQSIILLCEDGGNCSS